MSKTKNSANFPFRYQLTTFCPRTDIQFAIDQIERYEPKSAEKSYTVKSRMFEGQKRFAVFTKGESVNNSYEKSAYKRFLNTKEVVVNG